MNATINGTIQAVDENEDRITMDWVKGMPNLEYARQTAEYYQRRRIMWNKKEIAFTKQELKDLKTFMLGIHKYWSELDYIFDGNRGRK